jgi:hypothetical protein
VGSGVKIRLVEDLDGVLMLFMPVEKSIRSMVTDFPYGALVRFCSDSGDCQTTDTKVYVESVRKDRGRPRFFSINGRFSATFKSGLAFDAHFCTLRPSGKSGGLLCL